MPDYLTLQEVADYLRVNTKTIYRLLETGRIPATKVGHQWRFSKSAIDEWLNKKSVGTKTSILVIDDEEIIRALFKETLEELGHTVVTVGTASEGLALVKQREFDLVFLDLKMPIMDGAELLRQIKMVRSKLPVTIVTGYPEGELMARALTYGPFSVMKKPIGETEIIAAVQTSLRTIT
jgi:excisionase family DNA binding protein